MIRFQGEPTSFSYVPPLSSIKSNLFSSSDAKSFLHSSGLKPLSWNSTLLILMLRMKEDGSFLRISWAISMMSLERFSRHPPYLSVRRLVVGERNWDRR